MMTFILTTVIVSGFYCLFFKHFYIIIPLIWRYDTIPEGELLAVFWLICQSKVHITQQVGVLRVASFLHVSRKLFTWDLSHGTKFPVVVGFDIAIKSLHKAGYTFQQMLRQMWVSLREAENWISCSLENSDIKIPSRSSQQVDNTRLSWRLWASLSIRVRKILKNIYII